MISWRNDDTGLSLQNMMITERNFNREHELDRLLFIRSSNMMNEYQYQCSDTATAVSSLSLSFPSLPSSSYLPRHNIDRLRRISSWPPNI